MPTADPLDANPAPFATLDDMANGVLGRWTLPEGALARLINLSENATYLVEAPLGARWVLRVHRPGYHTRRAIACELAWLDALRADHVIDTPAYLRGKDGHPIQTARLVGEAEPRFLVLFEHIDGQAPAPEGDLGPSFEELGALAARCHRHASSWAKPAPFERPVWDCNAVFGPQAIWGAWRDAPGVTPEIVARLAPVEAKIRARLNRFGQGPERFNLIHGDMRLANLLVGPEGTRLIDFDDCGLGWFLYDFAAAISFLEGDPRVPAWKAAWLRGYRQIRELSVADIAEIDTLVMLRRLALLAWIGSHLEAPEAQHLAPGFAATTAALGQDWLARAISG